jgi:hypothetical protein
MAMPRHAMRFTMFAVLAALAGAAIASACGSSKSSGTDQTSPSPAATDQLTARVQRDEMLNAVVTIGNLGIHDLDTKLQNGTIDSKYVPTVRLAVRLLALTDWTDDVKPAAMKFHDDAVKLLQGLDAGNAVDTLKPLSTAFHEDYHAFSDPVWNSLTKDLPPDAGGPAPTKAPSTPAAGATSTATPMSH